MKKYLSLVLIVEMLIGVIAVGCAKPANNPSGISTNNNGFQSVSAESDTEVSPYDFKYPVVPESVDYDGKDFVIMTEPDSYCAIVVDSEKSEDMVASAAYYRNLKVEDALSCSISYSTASPYNVLSEKFLADVQSGVDDYDLFYGQSVYLQMQFATSGVCYNWNDLDNICDFAQPYWNQSIQKELTVNDVLFIQTGDYCPRVIVGLVFSKQILDDDQQEYPYASVNAGSWTWDEFMKRVKPLSHDINGDSVYDENDQFGFGFTYRDYLVSFMYGCNIHVVEKDNEDYPNFIDNVDKLQNLIDNCYSLCFNDNICLPFFDGESTPNDMFFNEQVAYTLTTFDTYLREVEFDYGIVPVPKYDERQDKYYTNSFSNTLVVPRTVKDPDFVAWVTELLNAESRKSFTPIWIDSLMSEKVATDEESKNNINYLYDNLIYDFGYNYSNWNNILFCVPWMMKAKYTDVPRWIDSNKPSMVYWYDSIYSAMNTYEG